MGAKGDVFREKSYRLMKKGSWNILIADWYDYSKTACQKLYT